MNKNKIKIGINTIEIRNNWIGVQTVLVNNVIVSKKFSFSKIKHTFAIMEEGIPKSFTIDNVISKDVLLKDHQVLIDIKCDGKLIKENLLIDFESIEKKETNESKIIGIQYLREYETKRAINAFKFGLACCYSIEENRKEGFECIMKAFENNLNDKDLILNHEMLAYLRIQDGFEDFLNTDFTKL